MEMQITVTEWVDVNESMVIKKDVTFTVQKSKYEELRQRYCAEHDYDAAEGPLDFEQWLFEELVA
jgi:hypothetical protein